MPLYDKGNFWNNGKYAYSLLNDPNFTGVFTLSGEISIPADFPELKDVKSGDVYLIKADVTDNDASKTNTGQSFKLGDEVAWTSNGNVWIILGNENVGGIALTTFSNTSVFVASSLETYTFPLTAVFAHIARGRFWINANPGSDFDDNLTLSFYTKPSKKGEDLGQEFLLPVLYRQLDAPMAQFANTFTYGGAQNFQKGDLIKFLGSTVETHLIIDITGLTITIKDTVQIAGGYGIGTGISLVSEISAPVLSLDPSKNIAVDIEAQAPVTVNIRSELDIAQ